MMTTPCQPLFQATGAQFTTYRIGGPLEEAYQPETVDDAIDLLTAIGARRQENPDLGLTLLGWGGNTLIASAGVPGVTVITRKMTEITPLDDTRFQMACGVHLVKAAKSAQSKSLHGGEYMIGIPGTIGGAVRMNAGAMHQETQGVIESVRVFWLETGRVETWEAHALQFSYRHSAIDPKRHMILDAILRFSPGDASLIQTAMDQNLHFRKTHHPTEPNGGSVFRNPSPDPQYSVGRMIDTLGGKTWTEGGVRVSPLHGNFIININQGTSTDVLKLMCRMKAAIKAHYGFDVFPENLFIGAATPEEQALWEELTRDDPARH